MNDINIQLRKRPSCLFLGLESIDFQTDNFGSQIEAVLYGMVDFIKERDGQSIDSIRVDLSKSEHPKILAETIFKRLGIRVKPILNTASFGAIMPFFVNENHVLLDKMWRGQVAAELPDQAKLLKTFKGKTGTVDLKTAHLGGIFSEYVHDMWLDMVGHALEYKTSVPEVTAIILHELGHAFTYYEMANRLEETNQVLAHLSVELRGENNGQKKKVIFKELASTFGMSNDEFDDLVEEKNQVILGLKFFKKYIKFVQSQMPNSKYNETASEQLADNFAARFGYGRELVSGLQKINLMFGSPEANQENADVMWMMELLFVHFLTFAALLSPLLIGINAYAILMPIMWVFIFFNSGEDKQDMTYDRLKMRYKRVRQQSIEMIQKLDMDKDQLRKVVDDIHFMDNIIQNAVMYRSIYNKLANFVFSSAKEAKKDIELQYLIEELTHSDLFLKSAELKVIY